MPLSTDKIPNFPLNGPEVLRYLVAMLRDELEHRSVPPEIINKMCNSLEKSSRSDFFFAAGSAYPRLSIQLQIRLHFDNQHDSFSIAPTFETQNPLAKNHSVFVRGVAPPLMERGIEGERVECFTLRVVAENPNLIRIHYGIPIIQVNRIPPAPGQMFPGFESKEIEVDPAEYPEPKAPEVTDECAEFESAWGVSAAIPTVLHPGIAIDSNEGNSVLAVHDKADEGHSRRRGRPKGQR